MLLCFVQLVVLETIQLVFDLVSMEAIRNFPDDKKVKEAYTPVAFMSRVELYVCMFHAKIT